MTIKGSQAFENIARKAARCRECFILQEVRAARIDVAQPLWVGGKYWSAKFRLVILMCNPGEGLKYAEWADDVRRRLYKFRAGTTGLGTLLEDQRGANWWRFYVDGMHLDPDEIAFANVAWCATKGNRYPATVLQRCFKRHTGSLLELLRPNVVLAAGRKAQAFAQDVSVLSCGPRVIPVLHHAHRKGHAATEREFKRVGSDLKRAQFDKTG